MGFFCPKTMEFGDADQQVDTNTNQGSSLKWNLFITTKDIFLHQLTRFKLKMQQ